MGQTNEKSIKSRMINVRLKPELAEQLRQIAEEQHISVSAFARQSILKNVRLYIEHERAQFTHIPKIPG